MQKNLFSHLMEELIAHLFSGSKISASEQLKQCFLLFFIKIHEIFIYMRKMGIAKVVIFKDFVFPVSPQSYSALYNT